MELEQVNSTIETDVMDTEDKLRSEEGQILNINIEEQLDDLASLLVEKILADSRFNKVLNSSRDVRQQTETRRPSQGDRESRSRPIRIMRDLIDYNRKSLELGQNVNFAKQYLDTIRLIYSELSAELDVNSYQLDGCNDESSLEKVIRETLGNKCIVELLYRIETFVLVLAYSATPAYIFDDEDTDDLERESIDKTKKRITALGYELLYLFDNLEKIHKMEGKIHCSSSIQLFLKFMKDYRFQPDMCTGKGSSLLAQEVYFGSLNELNYILCKLKDAIGRGEFEMQTSFWHQTEMRKKRLLKGIVCSDTIKGVSTTEFKTFVHKYSKRLNEAITYFRGYKEKSITLYRFRILLDDDTQKVTLDERKKFFGELNKKAVKPTVGFRGYLNFFYFWDKYGDQWFQDIVIVMDSDTLLQVNEDSSNFYIRSIKEEFQQYASELLEHRGSVIFENKKLPKIEIWPIPLMWHLDLPSQILIEVKDRDGWTLFEKKVLPFFIYHEFLELADDEEIRDRFSRGTRKLN